MLTQKDFGILKGIKIYSYACDSPKKYFHIPDPYQLYKEMVARINNKGFSSVKRASPKDANLIIRVYQAVHHEHEFEKYSMYGVDCYVKNPNNEDEWITRSNWKDVPLNYAENRIGQWLFPDEIIKFNSPDFMDFYVVVNQ